MNSKPQNIDFFKLSDVILEKLNIEGKTKLTHYDISLKLIRDINYPSNKFNIYLNVFNEEYSNTYYTADYNSIEKIVAILFLHAKDDYGHADTRQGLTSTKRIGLENALVKTIENVLQFLTNRFKKQNEIDFNVFVDEQFPYDKLDEKGLPFYELNVNSIALNMDIRIALDFNSTDFSDEKRIMEELANKINNL